MDGAFRGLSGGFQGAFRGPGGVQEGFTGASQGASRGGGLPGGFRPRGLLAVTDGPCIISNPDPSTNFDFFFPEMLRTKRPGFGKKSQLFPVQTGVKI